MDKWEVNYKDGQGWQAIDEEAIRLELPDCRQLDFANGDDGEVKRIETDFAKYRRVTIQDLPLDTRRKVRIDENGDAWAI